MDKRTWNSTAYAALRTQGADAKALWPHMTTARKEGLTVEAAIARVTQAVSPVGEAKAPGVTRGQRAHVKHRCAGVVTTAHLGPQYDRPCKRYVREEGATCSPAHEATRGRAERRAVLEATHARHAREHGGGAWMVCPCERCEFSRR